MRPAWLQLLHYNSNKRFGLTLPFLIGALRTPPGFIISDESLNLSEFQALLESIRDNTSGARYVRIAECDKLHQPVVALGYNQFQQPFDKAVFSPGHASPFLFVEGKYLPDETQGIASLTMALWQHCAPAILEGRFSFRNAAFHTFDDNDLRLIANALSSANDDEA